MRATRLTEDVADTQWEFVLVLTFVPRRAVGAMGDWRVCSLQQLLPSSADLFPPGNESLVLPDLPFCLSFFFCLSLRGAGSLAFYVKSPNSQKSACIFFYSVCRTNETSLQMGSRTFWPSSGCGREAAGQRTSGPQCPAPGARLCAHPPPHCYALRALGSCPDSP